MEKGPHDYHICENSDCKSLVRVVKGSLMLVDDYKQYQGWNCPVCQRKHYLWPHLGEYTSEDLKTKLA